MLKCLLIHPFNWFLLLAFASFQNDSFWQVNFSSLCQDAGASTSPTSPTSPTREEPTSSLGEEYIDVEVEYEVEETVPEEVETQVMEEVRTPQVQALYKYEGNGYSATKGEVSGGMGFHLSLRASLEGGIFVGLTGNLFTVYMVAFFVIAQYLLWVLISYSISGKRREGERWIAGTHWWIVRKRKREKEKEREWG